MTTMPFRIFILLAALGLSACASSGPAAQSGTANPPAQQEEDAPEANAGVSSADAAASQVVIREDELDLEPYQLTFEESLVDVDMIPIPPGSIMMETEDGPTTVAVGPFWMSRTEVPWELFDMYAFGDDAEDALPDSIIIVRPSKPYGAPDRGFGHRGYAAISMSYVVALEFGRWLSAMTGDTYRIPTEAEWEYACRAGREDPIPQEELEEHAWYWDNAFDETHPIAELAPNEFGLHDLLCNAAEWCTGLDGEGLACGGHYLSKADEVHCGARLTPTPKWQETDPQIPKSMFWLTDGPFMGFRIIRVE